MVEIEYIQLSVLRVRSESPEYPSISPYESLASTTGFSRSYWCDLTMAVPYMITYTLSLGTNMTSFSGIYIMLISLRKCYNY